MTNDSLLLHPAENAVSFVCVVGEYSIIRLPRQGKGEQSFVSPMYDNQRLACRSSLSHCGLAFLCSARTCGSRTDLIKTRGGGRRLISQIICGLGLANTHFFSFCLLDRRRRTSPRRRRCASPFPELNVPSYCSGRRTGIKRGEGEKIGLFPPSSYSPRPPPVSFALFTVSHQIVSLSLRLIPPPRLSPRKFMFELRIHIPSLLVQRKDPSWRLPSPFLPRRHASPPPNRIAHSIAPLLPSTRN